MSIYPKARSLTKFRNPFTYDLDVASLLFDNDNNYPPHNVYFANNDDYCVIEIAVSGFSKDEITINFDGRSLTILGEKNKEIKTDDAILPFDEENIKWVKRGLAKRNFNRQYVINGNYKLEKAVLKNGILIVLLKDQTEKVSIDIVQIE